MTSHNNNVSLVQLSKLNGRNYHHWSIQMQVFFESQELWSVVEDGVKGPATPTVLTALQNSELKENKKKDKKALFYIYKDVDEVIFERISLSTSSKEAWDMLYKTYRGEERVKIVRLQTLRSEFDSLKMRESESVEDFYNRVILLLNQLRLNGEIVEDKRVVEKILRSLTRKFEYIVVAIEESKDLSTLSLENLLGTLQSHELRMRNFDDSPMEQAFHSQVSTKEKKLDHEDHGERTSKSEDFSNKKRPRIPLSEKQCYYCHKYGHTMKFCKKKQQDEHEDAKFMNEPKEVDKIFMTFEIDELVKDDVLIAKDNVFKAVDDALNGNFWNFDD